MQITPYPLHPAQQDVYTDQLIDLASSKYNVGGYLKLKGPLNIQKFRQVVISAPGVFDAFKIRFDLNESTAACYFDHSYEEASMAELDFSNRSNPSDEAILWMQERFNTAFMLEKEHPLFEQCLIKINNDEHWFFGRYHHLMTDGYGFVVWVQYMARKYQSLIAGDEQVFSYPLYQEEILKAAELLHFPAYDADAAYWKEKIQTKPEKPLQKKQHLKNVDSRSITYILNLTTEQRKNIEQLQVLTKTGLQQLTIAALLIYLGKTTGQEEFIFGIPVHKRGTKRLRNMVGTFTGVLPYKGSFRPDQNLADFFKEITASQRNDYRHQNYLIGDLSRHLKIDSSEGYLSDIIINYEPLNFDLNFDKDIHTTISRLTNEDERDPLKIVWRDYNAEQPLQLHVHFSNEYFSEDEIKLLAQRLVFILEQFAENPDLKSGDVDILPLSEKNLLQSFNNTKVVYPVGKTMVDLFEERVLKTPHSTAVVYGQQQLTYIQLNKRANQLAHFLRSNGLKQQTLVPICMERSLEMMIAIISVLKAGAAYVPIDPSYPANRLAYMIADTGATLILSSKHSKTNLQNIGYADIVEVDTDWPSISNYPDINLALSIQPHHLADVIYTSGSTGNPKGVCIMHAGNVNMSLYQVRQFGITENDKVLQFASISFDASVSEIFMAFFAGATLVLMDKEKLKDGENFAFYLKEKGVSVVTLPPVFLKTLDLETLRFLRVLITAGEPASEEQAADLSPYLTYFNAYGPTECAVCVSIYQVLANYKSNGPIPIGKPIANTWAYVLDEQQQLTPIGVAGELHVSGAGLAAGYLGLPELTADKFITNPFAGGQRLYKTGDLCRWLPDGNLVFIGRMDEQVKIRGYRIEPGEVESLLEKSELVQQAAVLAKADKEGNKRLIGYVVTRDTFDKAQIVTYLQDKLPEYMIPALWVALQTMPVTANGKIDRKALPDPDATAILNTDFAAPRDKFEVCLAAIWQELLGIEQVGIHDNFFELGGDSIITIQLVSRARQLGYKLQVADVFTYQTIAGLSTLLSGIPENNIEPGLQDMLTGDSGLLPIQQWYLQKEPACVSHYNQNVLLSINKTVTADILNTAIELLVAHHDALRFKYHQHQGNWQQEYGTAKGSIITEDIHSDIHSSTEVLIKKIEAAHQNKLDITTGELIRVVWIKTPEAAVNNKLLIVIHHLVVDGVSWRILLKDLDLLLHQLSNGQKPVLSQKTTSYRQWYQTLQQYGSSRRLLSQSAYWKGVAAEFLPLKTDKDEGEVFRLKDTGTYAVQLDAEQTRRLLQDVPKVYHTEINDLLLCALAKTLFEWNNTTKLMIGLEGHGRENIAIAIDTSHTVGWFTTLFPVLLKTDEGLKIADLIKSVKEQLRLVPDKGLGYGVLKYLNKDEALAGKEPWNVVFNYLGQFDNVAKEGKSFLEGVDSATAAISEEQIVNEKISVNSLVRAGRLELTWSYSKKHFGEETIQKIAFDYVANLQFIIEHCLEVGRSGSVYTPSDYGLSTFITYKELDAFLNKTFQGQPIKEQVNSLYRLSGLQQGILFHGLYDAESGTYISQFRSDLTNVNIAIFKDSWQSVMSRHSILRSAFYHNAFTVPLQCVYKEVKLPIEILDYSHLNEEEQAAAISKFENEDIKKGFSFDTPPLMRIALIRLSTERFRMLWTMHHILLDGWSMPVVLEEFLSTYELLLSGHEISPVKEDKYEDFINYIEKSDKEQEEYYWRHYLKGLQQNTLLPFIAKTAERTKGVGKSKSVVLQIDSSVTKKIQDYSQKNRVTVNTIMQGVWSYLLHAYTRSNNVVYGVIVSGRPDDLPEVEQRVGMYINTLPLHAIINKSQGVTVWLQSMQEDQVASRRYQHTPLNDIQGWTGVQGDLFDSILVFENYPISKVVSTRQWVLDLKNVQIHDQNNYPLTIAITSSEQTEIQFNYNSNLIEEVYINKLRNHFEHVLQQIINGKENLLGDIKVLPLSDAYQLQIEFNNTAVAYPRDKTIIHLFEEQVRATPDLNAVVFGQEKLTYEQINKRSNQLAHYLISRGIKKEALVTICIERSVEMIVAILGVLKAGGAYVPVDPDYPIERIAYMLDDSGAEVIISSKESKLKLPVANNAAVIELDSQWAEISKYADVNSQLNIQSHHLAYVIYTSGSTGKPKGVMVEHGGVVNLALSQAAALRLKPGMKTLQFASLGFDASCYEIFNTLLSGGCLVLCTKDDLLSTKGFENVINKQQVDVAVLPPSYQHIAADYLGTIKTIVSAGEPLNEVIGRHIQSKGIRLVNAYGPTENTVCVSLTDNPIKEDHTVVIGKPISNVQVYILDNENNLSPLGIAGEICVAGVQVARGYLNRPELTAEKFIADLFSNDEGARLYKTGDLGRWLPDGSIEYLGRIDDQVKVRGYRIEPGEIESVLVQSGLVSQCVVLAKEDKEGNKRLVGYVVSNETFDKEAIISYLHDKLPEYMVPAVWVALESMPVTANGKTDRKALPDPDVTDTMSNAFVAPRNEVEEKLAAIWQELLELDTIGIHDNFFESGGDSLLAIRLLSFIHKELKVEIKIGDIFENATIELLAAHLEKQSGTTSQSLIEALPRPAFIPLSFSQERLWIVDQLEGSVQYHSPALLRLKGHLDQEALQFAFQTIINRHEALRTVFLENAGHPYQFIKDKEQWQLNIINGSKYKGATENLQDFIQQLVSHPFNLSRDYMLRVHLIQIEDGDHMLVVIMHHIASDAWSLPILVKEVAELYESYINNRPAQLTPLKLQYADFAIWQRQHLPDEALEAKLNYWKEKLDAIVPLQLPVDYSRPAVRSTKGASTEFTVDKELTQKLNALSQQHGATLYMTLLAAFNVLLYRYSGQQDICVGTSIAGRPQRELEDLIGFFVNTLALRNQVSGNVKFTELLEQVRTTMLEAYANQDVPFDKVVEAVVKDRDPGRSPLFQVMLVLGNTPDVPDLQLGDLVISSEPYAFTTAKFDLTFFFTESPSGLQGSVAYITDLFGKERIERMIAHYIMLLHSVASAAVNEVSSLQMMSEAELCQSKQGFNVSKIANVEDKTVIALFEKQAQLWPQSAAVSFEGEEVSFEELNERSNRLAHYLRSCGVKEDTLVPLFIDRGPDMITGILGILKAGGAYVPIDTGLPQERISFMLQDTAAFVIVCSTESSEKLPASSGINIIEIDSVALAGQPKHNLNVSLATENLAYVIYTSGSTGQPKGVMVTHGNLADYVQGLDERTGINSCNSFALVSTIATDLGNTVLFSSLISGGTLHVFSREAVSNIEGLHDYFAEHQIDCVKIVPSHWKALIMDGQPLLPRRLLVFGGESLQAEQVAIIRQSKRRRCRVVNHYGPTETTVGKLLYEVNFSTEYTGTIPIGKPFGDSRIYVLSSDMSLCPAGVPGQLYIGGAGVAKGYLNNEQLTREKFIVDPFDKTNGQVLYKTGDLVKYEPDGNIVFMGRIDDQVKIRGYRVEPGEVERVISQSGLVSNAVVLALNDKQENKRLVAYVVADDFDKEALNGYLKGKLPEYMVPSVLMKLEAMPLTANGKIDRKALPDPEAAESVTNQHVAPQTPAEQQMAAIWEEVLEVEGVGIHDDFFELGGHSLLAIRLISAIRKSFNTELTIGAVFDHPTIAGLLMQLQEQPGTETLPAITSVHPRPDRIPLSFSQERLWFIDRLEGSIQYHVPAVLRLSGILNIEALSNALQEITNRHEVLRTVIKDDNGKPYQHINGSGQWKLNIIDGKRFNQDSAALQKAIEKIINHPYDLSKDAMLRANVFTFSETDNLVVLVLHHIASDGWSKSVVVKELVELYDYYATGKKLTLASLPVQYADYAIWQRNYLQGTVFDEKLAYWKNKLNGVVPLQLPTDFTRPDLSTNRGAMQAFHIDDSLSRSLHEFSHQQGVTLFMSLITGFKVLLHRYTGQQDICIGTPVAGRVQTELEGLIGFFVNTLALRTEVNGNNSFTELLQQVKQTTLEAFAHQEIPFEKVVDAVVDERDISRNPIFQVMFVLRNTPEIPALRLGEANLTPEGHDHSTSAFDMQFFITETSDGLAGIVEYNTDLYKQETIQQLIAHYKELLSSAVKAPDQQVGLLPMLTETEKHQVLVEFNNTAIDYPKDNIITLFENQVVKTPELTAVVFEEEQLTYKQLNERANKLARHLRSKGVKEETLVPICVERGLEMIIGILGILKAGGAYVPVDPEYPLERINFMLEDIGGNLILSNKAGRTKLAGTTYADVIELDADSEVIKNQLPENLHISIQPNHLVYLIYTSGSTGKPKGVMIEHVSLVNRLHWAQDYYQLTTGDAVLQKTTYSFDVSVWELLWPLITGAKLVFAKPGGHRDNAYLKSVIKEQKITLLHFVPSMLGVFLTDLQVGECDGLKKVLCSGEALTTAHVKLFKEKLPQVELHNLYGPTEAAIDVTYWSLSKGENPTVIPIGTPVSNTCIYILNAYGQPVPVGVEGEIYIGGIQLARGYLNRPELTTERFVSIAVYTKENVRLYKTGDLGRWLRDGNVEYLRRMDNQVKIRGFRIELSEIESVLNKLSYVNSSCIVAKPDMDASNKLVSYYVPDENVVKEKEAALYQQQVSSWKALYESEYEQAETDENIDSEFNIVGWNDSFTGQPIAAGQMKEWVDDIVSVILSEKPEQVLEIGCGTGLIYYPLAEKLKKYIGTDLSQHSINQVNKRISKGERDYCPRELKVGAAHEISLDANELVDTVILNSVIQYFPGGDYLGTVIEKSIALLKGKGRIIIGDVRDYRLLQAFKSRLLLPKLQGNVSIKEFNWAAEQDVLNEEELCFAPEYFYDLQQVHPQITHIDIQWKKADYINELSLYRYTVVLYVGIEKDFLLPQWQSWNNTDINEAITQQLQTKQNIIAVKDVPNPRLWKERLLQKALNDGAVTKVDDVKDLLKPEDENTVQVNSLLQMAVANGYHYRLLLDEDPLLINIIFELHPSGNFIENVYSEKAAKFNGPKTNIPLFADISLLLQKDIKALLLEKLPEYMIPSEWVALGKLPLTINGKLDRKFLSEREDKIISNQLNYAPPRNETEEKLAAIWAEFLNLEKAGIYDNFFELGGHSLMAMRVISSIRRQLNLELAIKDLFLYPTIAQLSVHLQSLHKGALLLAIEKQQRPQHIPLSFSQERLWFIDKLSGSVHYHMPSVLRLKGKLDIAMLQDVLGTIIQRQEILRTVILEEAGQGYQRLMDAGRWKLNIADGSAFKGVDDLSQYIQIIIDTPFNLSADYLFRAHLIVLGEQEHLLVITMHHIVTDGWSISIFVNEVAELYKAFSENRLPQLPPLPIQYADYAIWQRTYLQGDLLERKLQYWNEKLAGVAPLQLPVDYPRPAVWSGRGSTSKFNINKKLTTALKALSQQQESTLFMTLLSAFNVLLHRYSGQNDICVGTTISNRPQQELEGLMGFFINTLALRSTVTSETLFVDLLQQVKNTTLEAYEHQEAPFEKVVDTIAKERDMSRNPVFQVLFTMQNTPEVPQLRFGEIELTREEPKYSTSRLDITFTVAESENGLQVFVEYATDLFSEQTILRMIGHYKELLSSIIATPDHSIGTLSIITPSEQYRLLTEFNDTFTTNPDKSLIILFEEQVESESNELALVFAAQQLTYRELNEQSNKLAHYLINKGVKAEAIVPVLLTRSMEMVVTIMGVLKAGAAYVPVDPDYPAERIAYMLGDIGADVIICSSKTQDKLLMAGNYNAINVTDEYDAINAQPATNPGISVTPHHLAYIIYTSGSTGRPKGVMIEHGSLLNYLLNSKTSYVTRNKANAGSFIHLSYTFDASLTAMFMPLLSGKSIVISANDSIDMFDDSNFHKYAPYDFIKLTPSHLELLQPVFKTGNGNSVTKKLVVGGEALRASHFTSYIENELDIEVVNEYGPTEATVGCSTYTFNIPADYEKIKNGVSIGKPIDNVQLYILGQQNELLPIGVAGEICIGGSGVARGYLKQTELTAEKFIPHPFSSEQGARLYKSGDVGRWLADGTLAYLGRKDDQVKVRGYRIEIGEVENVLSQHEGIQQCVVLAKEDANGRNRLLAYIVPGESFYLEGVISFLKEKLPEYMAPSQWIQLPQLPLTENGKVDRKALPDQDTGAVTVAEYVSAHTETEEKLVQIWQELLDIETVGIHDNFFQLGGDSILAIQLVSRSRNGGYEMTVADVFTYQTIAQIALLIEQGTDKPVNEKDEQGKLTGAVGLLPIQQWYLEKEHAAISHFNQSVLLTIDKKITASVLKDAMEQIVLQHDALRFKFDYKDGKWQQEYGEAGKIFVEEDGIESTSLISALKTITNQYQRDLDVEKSEILRAVLIKTSEAESANRLFIVIHHLVVDGVSWRILLQDLEELLGNIINKSVPVVKPKSSSYRQWYDALVNYGKTEWLLGQYNYWQNAAAGYVPLPVDNKYEGVIRLKDIANFTVKIGAAFTRNLIQEVPRVYHTEINDILLSALVKTISAWSKQDSLVIGLEGHGREHISDEIDVTHTVGWFTSLYPLHLNISGTRDLGDVIKTVKEQLRKVPDKGLGYGVVKYINKESFALGNEPWDIQFNYLGQLDNVVKASKWLAIAAEPNGEGRSAEQVVNEKLSVLAQILGGELILNWSFSTRHFEEKTIKTLADSYITQLNLIIEHCMNVMKSGNVFTPSDYGLGSDVSYEELDTFMQEEDSDNIMSF